MKHLLIIFSILLPSSPLFGKGEETGVLFERRVNGKFGWYKGGDEKKDWKYVGEIKNGKPNGHGTLTKPEGSKYVGKFNDGKYHGQGTLTLTNGTRYEGEWKDGFVNGQGTYTFRSGIKGVGEFRKDKPWNITEYDKNGNINGKYLNGEWIKN